MKNQKAVILIIVLLTTIVAGCNRTRTTPDLTIDPQNNTPISEITVTPTDGGQKACPVVSNIGAKTALSTSITDITFAIDESVSFTKLDENNRYKQYLRQLA